MAHLAREPLQPQRRPRLPTFAARRAAARPSRHGRLARSLRRLHQSQRPVALRRLGARSIWIHAAGHPGHQPAISARLQGSSTSARCAKRPHPRRAGTPGRIASTAEHLFSFWESYDLRWAKDTPHLSLQADGTSGFLVSLAHGWSSGPTAWLSEQVLGVRNPANGYRSVTIAPRLLGLAWARGSVPTPHGVLHVTVRKEEENQRITLEIPPGIEEATSMNAASTTRSSFARTAASACSTSASTAPATRQDLPVLPTSSLGSAKLSLGLAMQRRNIRDTTSLSALSCAIKPAQHRRFHPDRRRLPRRLERLSQRWLRGRCRHYRPRSLTRSPPLDTHRANPSLRRRC